MTRRKRNLIIAGGAAVLLMIVIGSIVGPDKQNTQPTSLIGTAPPVQFDSDAFAAWWTSGAVPPNVQAVTGPERIQWTGYALSAQTSIYPDKDAKTAATAVCSTLSAFWLSVGSEVRPVQVLGTDGGVLVSRRSAADQCEWRGKK